LLAPGLFQLVSFDFGGCFAREARFFRRFPTTVCHTNLRGKGWHTLDWRFMGAASCLYADHLDLGATVFADNFEASRWSLASSAAGKPPSLTGPFGAAGLAHGSATRGLTQFGSAMILRALRPDLLGLSLTSLAAPGSEKQFRKRLLLDVVRHRFGGPPPAFASYVYPHERAQFGKQLAIDFFNLYCTAAYGPQTTARWIDRPPRVHLANLDFVFKFNHDFVHSVPSPMRPTILLRMGAAGIRPFGKTDWEGLDSFRTILARYHPMS
jgi:hypothetical protein